jgi:adhesin/invasin
VIVKDVGGNPVSGVQVTFAVASGGGGVTGGTQTTNGSGIATVGSWTLGPTAGTNNNTLTATATGSGIAGNPVTFTASASAGTVSASQSTLTVNTNTITAGGAGSTVTVTAKDASGNPISGATVDLSATNGGSFTPHGTTNGSGVTTSTFTSTAAGDHNITATITKAPSSGVLIDANATVTVTAGAASVLEFTQGPTSTTVNAPITPPVVVSVTDAFGNPTEATVHLDLNQVLGGATLNGTVDVGSVNGVATFSDLSVDQASFFPYSLTASAGSATPVTSNTFLVNP